MRKTSDDAFLEADDVALDLKGILAAVWRRRLRILLITLMVGGGTFVGLSMISPRYMAETRVLVEDRDIPVGPTNQAANNTGAGTIDQEAVLSQVQVLTSRDLIRRVAEKNKLADLPEFDGTKVDFFDGLMMMAGLSRDPMRVSPEERMIDLFLERLLAFRAEGSRVLVIQFTSKDPELSARVANSLAQEYMLMQGEAKKQNSKDQTAWLGDEIARLQDKLKAAESAVEKYRTGSDLFVGENNALVGRQQISDINNSIAAARADQASAESKAKQLSDLLRKNGSLGSAADVIDSDNFRSLRTRESALRTKLSELSVALLPGHPEIKAIQSQIADIVHQQVAEARRVLAAYENDANVAAARVANLQDNLAQLKVSSSQDNESSVQLRALERDAATQRTLLEGLMARYREATAVQGADSIPADARIISRAATPAKPNFPKVIPYSIVATVAALLLSIAWTIAAEFLSGRALMPISTVPAAPRVLRAPQVGRELDEPEDDEDMIDDAPMVADRVERFRSRIGARAKPRMAPVADTAPRLPVMEVPDLCEKLAADGAVRVAVISLADADMVGATLDDFAEFSTNDGLRFVLVDMIDEERDPELLGLTDLIAGEADFDEIIRRNQVTHSHEILIGTLPLDRSMLIGEGMETTLEALEQTYDLVVMDLGPLSADPGRFHLVAASDHVVLVGSPEAADVIEAHDMLQRNGITRLSILPVYDDATADNSARPFRASR